jgi:hypothetical protein
VQRVLEVPLGPGGGARASRQQDHLAFDAQELETSAAWTTALEIAERLDNIGMRAAEVPNNILDTARRSFAFTMPAILFWRPSPELSEPISRRRLASVEGRGVALMSRPADARR